jgi:hypothetical protein
MKPIRWATYVCLLILAACVFSRGQADTQSSEVTLCELYQHPEQYAGKMVKVRGRVAGNDIWIDDFTQQPCSSWLRVMVVFPSQVVPAPNFDLVHDDSFKEFQGALYRPRPIHIEATFEGRFDSIVSMQAGKRTRVGQGYGKNHNYDGRVVLHRVSDVVAKPLPRK